MDKFSEITNNELLNMIDEIDNQISVLDEKQKRLRDELNIRRAIDAKNKFENKWVKVEKNDNTVVFYFVNKVNTCTNNTYFNCTVAEFLQPCLPLCSMYLTLNVKIVSEKELQDYYKSLNPKFTTKQVTNGNI